MKCMKLGCLVAGISLSLLACSPNPPTEAELKAQIVGTYCHEGDTDYRFILTDSTYYSIRRTPGILQTQTKVRESCRGNYSLEYDGTYWVLRFAPDPDPDAVLDDCGMEYPVWGKKEGYMLGEDTLVLKELFDQHPVTRDACE